MNYSYIYVEDEQEMSSLQQTQTEMRGKNAAACFFDYGSTTQWEQLQAVWKQSDVLYIQDITHLVSEIREPKHRLSTLRRSGVCVKLRDEHGVDLEQMLQLVNFMIGTVRKCNYALQLEGTQKVLKEKRNGEDSYGRPEMALLQDFEGGMRKIMCKRMKHEDYRKQLGFKHFTCFETVKESWDDWKARDEKNETAALTQE